MLPGKRGLIGALTIAAMLSVAPSANAAKRAVVTFPVAQVGSPGNAPAAITPFTDAIYQSCASDPVTSPPCVTVGGVSYPYGIAELEVTVAQYVGFLNTVDPSGRNRHNLFTSNESSTSVAQVRPDQPEDQGRAWRAYPVTYPEWADKPYGFANFLRTARFANSLTNGRVLSKQPVSQDGFSYVIYKVRLSRNSERGMYDMSRPKTTRKRSTGFVILSQDEWIKAAYFDPNGGGMYYVLEIPDEPRHLLRPADPALAGPIGAEHGDAQSHDGRRHQLLDAAAGDLPRQLVPDLVSVAGLPERVRLGQPPAPQGGGTQEGLPSQHRRRGPERRRSARGAPSIRAATRSSGPTRSPPAGGRERHCRVWRRLHGGITNAPGYQLWLSAIGLQPQDDKFYNAVYPWLGFRIGVIGDPGAGRR